MGGAHHPLAQVTTHTRYLDGSIASITNARMNTTAFDRTVRTSTVTNPLGHSTVSSTSSFGLPTSTTFAGGASTGSTFHGRTPEDESGSFPVARTDESGRARQFSYDGRSVLQSVTDLGGNAWTYPHERVLGGSIEYDIFGGSVGLGLADARSPVSRYGGRNEERDGHRSAEVDAWSDRLSEVTSPEGEVTHWTFGPGGQVSQVDYPYGGTLTRTYGADLRMATETRPIGATLTYTHDVAGRLLEQ